jgi:hypothetical protein
MLNLAAKRSLISGLIARKENRVDAACHKLVPLVPEIPCGADWISGGAGSVWIWISGSW